MTPKNCACGFGERNLLVLLALDVVLSVVALLQGSSAQHFAVKPGVSGGTFLVHVSQRFVSELDMSLSTCGNIGATIF